MPFRHITLVAARAWNRVFLGLMVGFFAFLVVLDASAQTNWWAPVDGPDCEWACNTTVHCRILAPLPSRTTEGQAR